MTTPRAAVSPQPPSAERFRLAGPSVPFDPRITPARRDIADIALADRLFAPYYARAENRRCGLAPAMLHVSPSMGARAVSQILPGEVFAVLDVDGDWAWGYCAHDRYVGYVRADALGAPAGEATHRVSARSALMFEAPDMKARLMAVLPMGSYITADSSDAFLAVAGGGFVHRRHATPMDILAAEPVEVACRMLGMPYLWGGRGGDGIDCSGLMQLALAQCGVAVPRDTDQQQVVGRALADEEPLRRGDLLFFPGHIGMMVDAVSLVHANAFAMAVTVELLADVVARIGTDHPQPVLARRRLS